MGANTETKSNILYNILYPVFQYKWIAFFVFIGVLSVILFLTYLITPTYKATAKILVRQNPKQQLTLFEDITTPGQVNPRLNLANNIIAMAQSYEIAKRIVREFRLDERLRKKIEEPEELRDIIKSYMVNAIKYPITFLKKYGLLESKPTDYMAEAIEEFLEDTLDVEPVEDTETINLTIWEESPSLATRIANTMANMIVERAVELDRGQTRIVYQFTKDRLLPAEAKYQKSLSALERFKEKWHIISFEEEKSLKLNNLEGLRREFVDTLVTIEDRKRGLEEVNERIAVQSSRLDSLQIYNELMVKKTELETEIQSLQGRKEELERNIKNLETELADIVKRENEFIRLEQQKNLDENLYLALKDKLTQFEVQKATQLSEFDIRIFDTAYVSDYADPDWPNLEIFLPLALFVSLFTSLGFAFLINYFDGSVKTTDEVEEDFGGFADDRVFNIKKRRELRRFTMDSSWRKSILNDFYPLSSFLIATNSNSHSSQKILLVTSLDKGDGKTYIGVNLSTILAMRNKKVLLMDVNPWNPSIHNFLGLQRNPGLVDLLTNGFEESYIHKNIKVDNLHVLSFGKDAVDPLELFLKDETKELLTTLRSKYDHIILDAAPLGWYETEALVQLADGILLILKCANTRRVDVVKAKEKIIKNGKLSGVILNYFHDPVPSWVMRFF